MNVINMVIGLFGGLGLFLYGMKMMGDGLANTSGEKLKKIFEKITSNPIKGVATGAAITAVIQSSSATTVMVVGFVNAGLMNLYQAAAVIMGANIGTTVTAQLIAFKLDNIIPMFLGIGSLTIIFSKGKKGREIGNIILGFGILFLGMELMKDTMSPLAQSPAFATLIMKLEGNTLLGILTGALMTAVIQSSSASTGILVALASTGALPLGVAVPILFGNNIGTCITALLSSIGTSKTAKKAALIHLFFNIFGTLIFIPLINPLIMFVQSISPDGAGDIKRQIANAHTIFNISNTIIMVPFIKYLVLLVNKIIPGEDEVLTMDVKYIDDRLLETPVIAVGQATKEVVRMANLAKANVQLAMECFINNNESSIKTVYENEKLINLLEHEITSYLVKLSSTELSEQQTKIVTSMFNVVNDIERIGDHAENLVDITSEKIQKNLDFSKDAMQELDGMYKYIVYALEISIESFENNDILKAESIMVIENRIDSLEKELRLSHIRRLNNGICGATVGTMFLDMISNFERIGDHATNIAEVVINK
ncbi:Na/Pi cotransporter family protein [Clostridium tagluense]|uniref:Na/Pi cotransporter family protein n=1 Tax=Clostridium tagluense TaxID=360422 RepID=UPI001C0E246C|nr:Na/Pi cotransporter family protein [Clostridium tagluense]MBU3128538.1 Na/Pi cotransporter family protein [Clostridium tagluense]MCB2310386.1 Na/Pi cotransporter family protein [Clostridium tagluense]MCB2315448.1 Na/Pi cotransporter family protein [Clostridium tagluense]MCB2320301.1 Na/Pi cotransporter family protein [Clostridium tagluense]MCB2325190.1 Na/Pi cotransporter family protein [Clostridium tagluense]